MYVISEGASPLAAVIIPPIARHEALPNDCRSVRSDDWAVSDLSGAGGAPQ